MTPLAVASSSNQPRRVIGRLVVLARADSAGHVYAFDPNQPRDDHGRWTTTGSYPPANTNTTMIESTHLGGVDTLQRFTRLDGTLTPERQALHNRIVDAALRTATPVKDQAWFYLMGGGGASGKSVMQEGLTLPKNILKVDVDAIRVQLPEWDKELARAKAEGRHPHYMLGSFTHGEASLISKRIVAEGVEHNYNVLLDGAGDSGLNKLVSNVAVYRNNGHKIIANYVTTDYDEAYRRMRERGDQTGRYIPAVHLREIHSAVAHVFPQAVQKGLFDEVTLWDTSGSKQVGVGKFSPPVKVGSGKGTSFQVHDQLEWNHFLERGKGIAPRAGEI